MTKYFKLLGIALLATSLAFVSCDPADEDDGTGTNPPVGNPDVTPDPNTPSVPTATSGTIAVTFGTDTWTAGDMLAGYFQEYNGVTLYAYIDTNNSFPIDTDDSFPIMEIYFYAPTSLIGSINSGEYDPTTDEYAGGELLTFHYYHEKMVYVDQNESGAYEQGEPVYGDYWAKNATITVSALDLTSMTMTATGAAVMFEALPVLQGQVALGASNRVGLSFNANAIDIEVAKGGAFKKAAKPENLSVARR